MILNLRPPLYQPLPVSNQCSPLPHLFLRHIHFAQLVHRRKLRRFQGIAPVILPFHLTPPPHFFTGVGHLDLDAQGAHQITYPAGYRADFDHHSIRFACFLQKNFHLFIQRGRQVLAHVCRLDGQLPMSAIHEHRQLNLAGPSEIDETIHCGAGRPAGE